MTTQILAKGTPLRLPVKEIRVENKRSYYIVLHEGREYAITMFEFQKDEPKPDMMDCIVKQSGPSGTVFIQDFSQLYKRFYTEGGVYPFRVRRDCTAAAGAYYEVADWNGFVFRLFHYGSAHLYEGQRIKCRVRTLIGNRLILELASERVAQRGFPLFITSDVLDGVDASEGLQRLVRIAFRHSPLLREAREAYDGDDESWVLTAIRSLDDNISSWVRPGARNNTVLLQAYHRVCLYLLEESDFLGACSDQERRDWQKMLSRAAQNAEGYMRAIRLIGEGEHVRQIDILLTKLKKSGYLFKPDKRLSVLLCLFSLDQQLMQQKMPVLFDIILSGNKECWRGEPFRSAFVEMLDLYVMMTRSRIDRLATIEDDQGRQWLRRIIEALSILLLLATEKDDFDRQLCMSMLYRYLTHMEGGKKDVLLEKSFRCLSEASLSRLEFGWDEVADLDTLAIRLSSQMPAASDSAARIMQTYRGHHAHLQMSGDHVTVLPSDAQGQGVPVIRGGMLPWNRVQVQLEAGAVPPLADDARNLANYRRWWADVEHNLFGGGAEARRQHKRHLPQKGDVVTVCVTSQDLLDPDFFLCRVEDATFRGEGRIHYRSFVRYGLRMGMPAFQDIAGRPYLLQAEVTGVNRDGQLLFSMEKLINGFVRQCLSAGDIARCVVLEVYRGYYLCVSDDGYSIQVPVLPDMPALPVGGYIEASVDEVGSGGSVTGSFVRQIAHNFSVQDAFANLINGYADEKVLDDDAGDTDVQQEVGLEESYVTELIHILDRKAVLDRDYVRTYNYLSVARILALLVSQRDLAVYYTQRMKLLHMLQDFVVNGRVDSDRLLEQGRLNADMVNAYPLLRTRLLELECISYMDVPERNAFLWEVADTASSQRLEQIARLVLSYNLLAGFSLHEQREAVREKIGGILDIQLSAERPCYFGREDLHTEFKSSLVYPAGRGMKPDLAAQTTEILKVVCGFLNAEGGTLYIGVNDEGVASGLEQDMPHFRGGSMDAFDLHVRNHIVQHMGVDANAHVTVSYPDAGKRTVYALHVQPSPHPVMLGGVYYVRQGSSTWPLLGRDLDLFLERKEAERLRMGIEPVAAEPDASPVAVEPAAEVAPAADAGYVYRDDSTVRTSHLRPNPVHNWEDGYGVDTRCWLHILPKNEYMLTDDECWQDVLLTLAVRECEADGWVVMVYSGGTVIRVPMAELLDKTFSAHYKRYSSDDLVFACPVTADDALLTVVTNDSGAEYYRLDDVTCLKEGRMIDAGVTPSAVECSSVVLCEVIPAQHKHHFRKIHNLRSTKLGNVLTRSWGGEILDFIEFQGIRRV